MADATFEALLTEIAQIARPVVLLDADGGPATPIYEPTGESVRVRIAPARAGSRDGLLGRTEEATHVIYAAPADLRVADRLIVRPVVTSLSADVEAGASVLPVTATEGLRDGQRVEIGGEELTVAAVGAGEIRVTPAVTSDYEAGEALSVVVRYEVLGVADEAGAGHHLRLGATEITA
jgi:hypothetical protein